MVGSLMTLDKVLGMLVCGNEYKTSGSDCSLRTEQLAQPTMLGLQDPGEQTDKLNPGHHRPCSHAHVRPKLRSLTSSNVVIFKYLLSFKYAFGPLQA